MQKATENAAEVICCPIFKGLSHEIDFKNFDKSLQNFFDLFRGSNDFIVQKFYLLRLLSVCVGLIIFSFLFLSVPSITSAWSIIEQGGM
jgi:hypothetical protein